MTQILSQSAADTRANGEARVALRLGLFGCPPGTGNRGVSALGEATTIGLSAAAENAGVALDLTVFDYGKGARPWTYPTDNGPLRAKLVGLFDSRRYYRPSNLSQMDLASRLGLNGVHPNLRQLRRLDAILDISGGDSFADLYGRRRFRGVALPKRLALRLGRPLILLPQTYGPFRTPSIAAVAGEILRGASQVWARDAHSLAVARSTAGACDGSRFHLGVDVAFGLLPRRPDDATVDQLADFRNGGRLLGLNVSGMLFASDEMASSFGLTGSYRGLIERLLSSLLEDPRNRVVLVPHVTAPQSINTGDAAAHMQLLNGLSPGLRRRVLAVEGSYEAGETKWIIGQCDWFCGTRMHACIAALSQGVACSAIAYSDKTKGVFESAGAGDQVVDPRACGVEEMVERVRRGLLGAAETKLALARSRPGLRNRLARQFEHVIAYLVRGKRSS